jgi:uncharacterized membrane-anchored protein YitT (DUF2179 family)
MFQQHGKSEVKNYFFIALGTALMAVAINSIYDPMKLVTGGFSGLAIVLKTVTEPIAAGGIPLWLTNAILNVPLFLIGIKVMGMRLLAKSLWGTVMLSLWLYVLPAYPLIPDDLVLAALFGGTIMGIGIGFVFRGQGTTGGTDMVSALIQRKLRHYSIAQIMMAVDGLIVIMGAWVFGLNLALYAIIAIFVTTKITDGLLEGLNYSKIAFIITDSYDAVAVKIMDEIERGVTGITAKGMYSNAEKQMLFCVVSKKEIVPLKELVAQTDEKAFVIVCDAREVLGEGFIQPEQKK